jgi:hypothetical protein
VHQHQRLLAAADDDPVRFINIGVVHDLHLIRHRLLFFSLLFQYLKKDKNAMA